MVLTRTAKTLPALKRQAKRLGLRTTIGPHRTPKSRGLLRRQVQKRLVAAKKRRSRVGGGNGRSKPRDESVPFTQGLLVERVDTLGKKILPQDTSVPFTRGLLTERVDTLARRLSKRRKSRIRRR